MNGVILRRASLLMLLAFVCVSCSPHSGLPAVTAPSSRLSPEELEAIARIVRFNELADKGSLNVDVLKAASLENDRIKANSRRPSDLPISPAVDAAMNEVRRYFESHRTQLEIDPDEVVISYIWAAEFPDTYEGPPADTSRPGYVRVERCHNGIRVQYSGTRVFFDVSTGEVEEVKVVRWLPFPPSPPVCRIDSSEAVSIAREHIQDPKARIGRADLHYYYAPDSLSLSWLVDTYSPDRGYETNIVVVNAVTGEIIPSRGGNAPTTNVSGAEERPILARIRQFNRLSDKGCLDVSALWDASMERRLSVGAERPTPGENPSYDAASAELGRFFSAHKDLLQIDPDEVVLSSITRFAIAPESPGEIQFKRFYKGIRVAMAAGTLSFDQNTGDVIRFVLTKGWDVTPCISVDDAIDSTAAVNLARAHIGDPSAEIGQADLEYSLATDPPKLYWYVYVWPSRPGPAAIVAVINAETGEVLLTRENSLHLQSSSALTPPLPPVEEANPSPDALTQRSRISRFNRLVDKGSLDTQALRGASGNIPSKAAAGKLTRGEVPAYDAASAELGKFFSAHKDLLQIDPDEVVLSSITRFDVAPESPGTIQFKRFYKGIRVAMAAGTLSFDENTGDVIRLVLTRGWDVTPGISVDDAIDSTAAVNLARAHLGEPDADVGSARLMYRIDSGSAVLILIWRIGLITPLPEYIPWTVGVDAVSGDVRGANKNVSY